MTVASGGPMYQFARLLDFPALGIEYPKALAKHYASVRTDQTLDVDACASAGKHVTSLILLNSMRVCRSPDRMNHRLVR